LHALVLRWRPRQYVFLVRRWAYKSSHDCQLPSKMRSKLAGPSNVVERIFQSRYSRLWAQIFNGNMNWWCWSKELRIPSSVRINCAVCSSHRIIIGDQILLFAPYASTRLVGCVVNLRIVVCVLPTLRCKLLLLCHGEMAGDNVQLVETWSRKYLAATICHVDAVVTFVTCVEWDGAIVGMAKLR